MSHKAVLRLRSASDGLTKLLPASEAAIMRIIWARGPCKVRTIYEEIAAARTIAYTTILTTCERMTEKGLLHRERVGLSYIYAATIGEREFVTRELAQV